jgi:hypothetical protein
MVHMMDSKSLSCYATIHGEAPVMGIGAWGYAWPGNIKATNDIKVTNITVCCGSAEARRA